MVFGRIFRLLALTKDEFPDLAKTASIRPPHQAVSAKRRCDRMAPVILQIRAAGHSFAGTARETNRRGIATTRGKKWTWQTVRNMLVRIANASGDAQYCGDQKCASADQQKASGGWMPRLQPFGS